MWYAPVFQWCPNSLQPSKKNGGLQYIALLAVLLQISADLVRFFNGHCVSDASEDQSAELQQISLRSETMMCHLA